ncbi:MAG: hypothetical protein ACLFPK_06480, partial [Desulfonatronovibrio sp.]
KNICLIRTYSVFDSGKLNSVKKSLTGRLFKNSKYKEQKKFMIAAYLDRCEFELFVTTKPIGRFGAAG